MTVSPWVLNAQSSSLPAKALVDGFAEPIPDDGCDYCDFSRSEGAVLVGVGYHDGNDFVTVLCLSCSKDPVLGACGHSRTCDCMDA